MDNVADNQRRLGIPMMMERALKNPPTGELEPYFEVTLDEIGHRVVPPNLVGSP